MPTTYANPRERAFEIMLSKSKVRLRDPILGTPLTFGGFNEYVTALEWYRRLWNKINGADAWDANPWVDVTKFDVLQQNVRGVAA